MLCLATTWVSTCNTLVLVGILPLFQQYHLAVSSMLSRESQGGRRWGGVGGGGRAERCKLSWVSLAAVLRGVPPPPDRAPENAPSTHLLARVLGPGPRGTMRLPLNCCSSCTSFGLWLFLLAPVQGNKQANQPYSIRHVTYKYIVFTQAGDVYQLYTVSLLNSFSDG